MLKKRSSDFAEQVWVAASRVGLSPPRITDNILGDLFPETCEAAENEGALKLLRDGCIASVKRVLATAPDDRQADFGGIDPQFREAVKKLSRPSYHVESLGEEVPVARLIAEPALLDDARKFMRRKGMECLEEARRLDKLFVAVTTAAEKARD